MKRTVHGRASGGAGFTLVEMMLVVAIIGTLLAVSIPGIFGYLRNYQATVAAQSVATEIQAGRMGAIKRNANYGTIFMIVSSTQFQFFHEDHPLEGNRHDYPCSVLCTVPLFDPAATNDACTAGVPLGCGGSRRSNTSTGNLQTLATGLEFVLPAEAETDYGFRFSRMGAMCKPYAATAVSCPDLSGSDIPLGSSSKYVGFSTTGEAKIRVRQTFSGIVKTVSVALGGRARVQ